MNQLRQLLVGTSDASGALLVEQILRCASGLVALGCKPADRVAVLMRNSLEQLTATLAVQHIGAYPVQLNWHGLAPELLYVLQDCGAAILVVHADLLQRFDEGLPPAIEVICVAPDTALQAAYGIAEEQAPPSHAVHDWASWMGAQEPFSAPAVAPLESIIYTSGTTGNPKGVRRYPATDTQRCMTEAMRRQVTGIEAGSRVMVPAPLYHAAPLMFAMYALRHAELLLLPPRFDAAGFLRDVERYRISHVFVVPIMFVRLLALPVEVRAAHDLSSLRVVLHAGGPCAPGVKRAIIDWLGPVIHEYYGSTEAGPCTLCDSADTLRHPGTVGRAVEGVAIEIQDEEGRAVPLGQVGELCVRNDAYADFTYLHRDADRAALQRGAYLASGDLGYCDAEGYYYLCDRKRDMVISGGVNIYPAEIEAAILELPQVADCAVFGIPDIEYGEATAALVQLHALAILDREQIVEHLRGRLASFKIPRLIEMRMQLPRDDAGKIRKRMLRDAYWCEAGRKI